MEKSVLRDLFKRTLVDFLDSLINILPSESDLIVARIYVNDKVSSEDLMNNFILKFMKFKSDIESKREKTFLENDTGNSDIFGSIPEEKLNHYRYLWRSGSINNDNKQTIWKWLNSFIKIIDKYQKTD